MAKTWGKQIAVPPLPKMRRQRFLSAQLNKGMITSIDPADLPPEALVDALNVRCRFDKTTRRMGSSLFTPAAPNTNPVLAIVNLKKDDGTVFLVRFASGDNVHKRSSSWVKLTTGTALTGGANDRYQVVTAFNKLVFANGKDYIQVVDDAVGTYARLGNAPKARYMTAFYNRIVAANFLAEGVNPERQAYLGWSAEYPNFTEWDPLVDISAGASPILESPSDLGDPIRGVFGFTNIMLLLRERSIWHATKLPIASQPFNFYTAVPGLGSNCPNSVAVTPQGLAFVDMYTGSVWHYAAGSQPERIGLPVEGAIIRAIDDPNKVFASYSPSDNEYTIGIPRVATSSVMLWIYNFRTQAWTRDERDAVTCIADSSFAAPTLIIDDLVGQTDQLLGTIDSLGQSTIVSTTKLLGKSNGDILLEDVTQSKDNNADYTSIIESKEFWLPEEDMFVGMIRIEYLTRVPGGTIKLWFTKDEGKTYRLLKVITDNETDKAKVLQYQNPLKARRFRWKLEVVGGLIDVLGYEIDVYPSGRSKQ